MSSILVEKLRTSERTRVDDLIASEAVESVVGKYCGFAVRMESGDIWFSRTYIPPAHVSTELKRLEGIMPGFVLVGVRLVRRDRIKFACVHARSSKFGVWFHYRGLCRQPTKKTLVWGLKTRSLNLHTLRSKAERELRSLGLSDVQLGLDSHAAE